MLLKEMLCHKLTGNSETVVIQFSFYSFSSPLHCTPMSALRVNLHGLILFCFSSFQHQQQVHLVRVVTHLTLWILVSTSQITYISHSAGQRYFNETAPSHIFSKHWPTSFLDLTIQLLPISGFSWRMPPAPYCVTWMQAQHCQCSIQHFYWHRQGKHTLLNRRRKHNERYCRLKAHWITTGIIFRQKTVFIYYCQKQILKTN